MAVTQKHITPDTPMGATRVGGGIAFRTWAPAATAVYLITDDLDAARTDPAFAPKAADGLVRQGDDTWTGFVEGMVERAPYRFWVEGPDGKPGLKRDPHAGELGVWPAFPDCDCLAPPATPYPWHDDAFVPPRFADLAIYQLHIGTYFGQDASGADTRLARTSRFLDLLFRLDYLRALGVNAIEPLPIQEYPSEFSMGYNGTDLFSPEQNYQVEDEAELQRYYEQAVRLYAEHGIDDVRLEDLRSGPNQLKCVIDLLHLNGLAVILDVVYNHAGGGFDEQSLYFFDHEVFHSNNDSLYFTDQGWAGGLVFAYARAPVRRFLEENAVFCLQDYHADGLRYDEVSVIDRYGGWYFAQELTATVRRAQPRSIQIAEYWNDWRWLAVKPPPDGMGFDAAWSDRLRLAVRAALQQASYGGAAPVSMSAIGDALYPPFGFPAAWTAVHCLENHDVVYADRPPDQRAPRIPRLADPSNARSWWARSRARAAIGLLLTAPGIPMLFMGEEFLEDKDWSDNPRFSPGTLIWWDGLRQDPAMRDFLTCVRDLLRVRGTHPGLRGEGIQVFYASDADRVLAFQRWVPGVGHEVVVVASLCDTAYYRYDLGFPRAGVWREAFNSDFYDSMPNPAVTGNGGHVDAFGPPLHGYQQSATIAIPPNGLLVLVPEGAT